MLPNPFVTMREALSVTQLKASQVSHVSEQYIRRQEQGTVSNPSGALAAAYYKIAESSNRLPELRYACRQAVQNLRAQSTEPPPLNMPTTFSSAHEFEAFVNVWYSYWVRSKRAVVTTAQLRACRTTYAICRLLVLHPYIVQQYQKRRSGLNSDSAGLPEEVAWALGDARLTPAVFEEALDNVDRTRAA